MCTSAACWWRWCWARGPEGPSLQNLWPRQASETGSLSLPPSASLSLNIQQKYCRNPNFCQDMLCNVKRVNRWITRTNRPLSNSSGLLFWIRGRSISHTPWVLKYSISNINSNFNKKKKRPSPKTMTLTQDGSPARLIDAQAAVLCPTHVWDGRGQTAAHRVIRLKITQIHVWSFSG